MPTIKNSQVMIYCNFNEIIKGSRTNFQSLVLSQKHVMNVCHTAYQYLTKFLFESAQDSKKKKSVSVNDVTEFETSQSLKSVNFKKPQKPRYLGNENLFFLQIKKLIDYKSRATLRQKIVLYCR